MDQAMTSFLANNPSFAAMDAQVEWLRRIDRRWGWRSE
jgi:hypothetical protein